MSTYETTPLNKVVRGPKRATYDKDQINEILDAKFLCHIAYTWEGKAIVIPTAYGRDGDKIYIHGSLKNRMMLGLLEAGEACISVTHLDGLVLARSAFHHSANYRSVNVFGKVKKLEGREEKMEALKCILNHMIDDHWENIRQPNEKELNATLVMEVSMDSASAKIRAEGAIDEKEDLGLPIWAGVVPIAEKAAEPVRDELLSDDIVIPEAVTRYFEKNK
ncbi:pyridoxamine 5'-phosphate oxidase family protein [Flammeovirgaceae bacterium SG7u.111]|nr:pyridoxamine 5'-phosphate oxidase family protein [Flammeovirgaceae bacterium SG7u.132]WPO36015.1 pyridoxamine 5'-phosphate oxidase family protein [Flammeovirgaceae bacterium SG7u.111]